ncbi:MAG: Gfo/Idh/MocA family oxidoreductase [Pseudomonadota bacterium]
MKKIRLGMVGGGNEAFIGAVHRIASRLDAQFELVAGALSSTPEKSRASGAALGLAPDRSYADYHAMLSGERGRSDGIQAVSIVTPNHMHFEPAAAFLKAGVHVICEKPLTASKADAKKLVSIAGASKALFVLTHNYTGYPMVRQAREMVAGGELGKIRVVQVEYPQEWLAEPQENKQAEWRTDPARSGLGGSVGDIGTHAFNLAEYVTGLKVSALAADLQSFVPGRRLDDNAHVLLRLEDEARGMLWSSQVAPGHENSLRLRVYGDQGSVEWAQEQPNELRHTPLGKTRRIITRGHAHAGAAAERMTRIPAGHPEGYLEAFANIYSEAATAIRHHAEGTIPDQAVHFPTISDGLRGVMFIEACVASSNRNAAWTHLDD